MRAIIKKTISRTENLKTNFQFLSINGNIIMIDNGRYSIVYIKCTFY